MKFGRTSRVNHVVRRSVICGVVGAIVATGGWSGSAVADPAQDALAQLGELSRRAEQLTESMHSAQIDLDNKLRTQAEADRKHTADLAALGAATEQLSTYQASVNTLAASVYMGGRTDGLNAILTASSPQNLIDKMSVQRVMAIEMAQQMSGFRTAREQATAVEAESAASAAEAKTAADDAAAVRADLQRKQSELQVQISAVKARYAGLTTAQQAALAAPPQQVAAGSDLAVPVLLPTPTAPTASAAGAAGASGAGAAAVQAALTRLGSPYVWGGSGPSAFDCSGLVMWSFQQAGVFLPHSSQAQSSGGQPVSIDQMQPGDIVAYYSDASHVGLYIGGGMMVHASTFGVPVAVVPVNNAPIYNVRRY